MNKFFKSLINVLLLPVSIVLLAVILAGLIVMFTFVFLSLIVLTVIDLITLGQFELVEKLKTKKELIQITRRGF